MATHEKVDVVIVGAGASGSLYAAELTKAGKKVVLLESGPDWQLTDLVSSDIWGRRIKPAGQTAQPGQIGHRHDSRHDRCGDAGGQAQIQETQKHRGVEEEVGNRPVGTGVQFALEIVEVGHPRLRLRM